MDSRMLIRQLADTWHEKLLQQPIYANLFAKGFSLEQSLTMKQTMQQLYESFSEIEKSMLKTILTRFGTRPFREADLTRLSSEQLIGLVLLRQKAVVLTLKTSWEEPEYFIPKESIALWHQIVFASELDDDKNEEQVTSVTSESIAVRLSLLNNLFRVLLYCSTSKLEKTKQQAWNKRQQANVEKELTFGDHLDLGERALDYILNIARHFKLIHLGSTGVTLLPHRIQTWLEQPLIEIQWQLYRYVRDREQLLTDVSSMHFIYWCEAQQSWFCLKDFERWAEKRQLEQANIQQSFEQWLTKLYHFGWMERGTGEFRGYYRLLLNEPDWCKEAEIYVKPDFELFLTASAPLSVRFLTEMFAERQSEDTVITYVLTKEKVQSALDHGFTVEDWINKIAPYVKYGIPDNVAKTLAEWDQGESPFRLDLTYPEIPDLYPGLREIPSMWLNEMRSYHPSTSKAIFEKALLWRTYVKCEAKEKPFRFVPERIKQVDSSDWVIIGKSACGQSQQLHANERVKLQLVLPGVNDQDSLK